jgi:hypothetical protein
VIYIKFLKVYNGKKYIKRLPLEGKLPRDAGDEV